jgi:hypothetical protein
MVNARRTSDSLGLPMNTAGKTLISVGLALACVFVLMVWLSITGVINPDDSTAPWGVFMVVLVVAGGVVGLVLYFLPTMIAWYRDSPVAGSVTVVNLFLGWTFIGWVVALAMAVGGRGSQKN